ncbi:MAG TPA: hypothetical protein VK348_07430 [Planctomycetota bacterium]|nr:hypothetical protein [Planctomycetota bacterium]
MLSAFAATLWLFGPRAAAVLAARLHGHAQRSPPVALDRVTFRSMPAWLQGPLLLAVARDLQPYLRGETPILDEDAAVLLQRRLQDEVAWVLAAQLQRKFPDRFELQLDLRRPVLLVRWADGEPLCLLDATGVAMPPVVLPELPQTQLLAVDGNRCPAFRFGQPFPDPRAVAAAAVAVEWRASILPLVPNCPRLLEVDATNLGERWVVHPRYPEIRVGLARADGQKVMFGYDRSPTSLRARVPAASKAEVLLGVLSEHPGLQGLSGGDLRFARRWRDYLQPSTGPDPVGAWTTR